MIYIPFVPGSFGSTIEYVLRNFTNENEDLRAAHAITKSGSMHTLKKLCHPTAKESFADFTARMQNRPRIATPIYPAEDAHAVEVINTVLGNQQVGDKIIVIHVNDLAAAEINILFQYYKIATVNRDLGIFCNSACLYKNWNKEYTSWRDMAVWELREWFSLFYVSWVQEWILAVDAVPPSTCVITNTAILTSPAATFKQIIKECGFTLRENRFIEFVDEWRDKQQYVLDEHTLINRIVDSVISGKEITWKKLHIIAEGMIQQKLRTAGYEIKCWKLNEFPTDTKTLSFLLEENFKHE